MKQFAITQNLKQKHISAHVHIICNTQICSIFEFFPRYKILNKRSFCMHMLEQYVSCIICLHACTLTQMHAYVHACLHAYLALPIYLPANMPTCIHTYIHTYAYMHINTHTYTYIPARTHSGTIAAYLVLISKHVHA